ncbi:MAG: TraB/GumN family protein [Bacteroidales bacterium]|nr:TraB/GumN family protein [Bacteroidales bacterium]
MKRRTAVCILYCIVCLNLQTLSSAANAKEDNALLWEISGRGLKRSSFLFAVRNTVDSTFLGRVERFYTTFHAIEQVAVEVNTLNMNPTSLAAVKESCSMKMKSYGAPLMPLDTTYQMLYNASDLAFVNARLTSSIPSYDRYTPYDNAMSYLRHMDPAKRYNAPSTSVGVGMDLHIMNLARNNFKKLTGLVSDKEFLSFKNAIPSPYVLRQSLKAQALGLLLMLKAGEEINSLPDQIDSIYLKQDLDELNVPIDRLIQHVRGTLADISDNGLKKAYTAALMEHFNGYYGLDSQKRVTKWMERIPSLMKKNRTLIAVDARYVIGTTGLINQLRAYGYTVTPVKHK